MAQWLEHGALQLPLPVVRVQTPLEAGFQINIMFLNVGTLFRCLCPWAMYFNLFKTALLVHTCLCGRDLIHYVLL